MSLITKLFGDPNEKYVKKLQLIVDQINSFEKDLKSLSDDALKIKTAEFKDQLKSGKTLDDILPEAFACVREASRRVLGMRHFDVQMIGGIVLHRGQIAEMKTGEGKTLVATLPLYLNSLTDQGCHLVTPNDYLSRHGAGWMGSVYSALGVSVSVIMHEKAYIYDPDFNNEEFLDEYAKRLKPCSRREAYLADITYGTNNEFGFDYLRDNMVMSLGQMAQRDFAFAIVDEVDSILIDEARTPLIISAPAEESTQMYYQFANLVKQLVVDDDYNVDEKLRAATLTEKGLGRMEKWLGVDNIYVEGGIKTVHHVEQALKAETLFKKDKDYIVKDGEVIIIDEFTGRLMHGRRYSEGLHQAIEAKEGVEIQRESQTLATVTFQNYFRMYKKLAGMTGTARTESEEFSKIYKLEVVAVPTNKTMIRQDNSDLIYKTEHGKYMAVVNEVKERNKNGQPILIGTISIEKNELMGDLLSREGIECQILNAKHHEKEALYISNAGKFGAVTVATNMAGRGVDIILGGEPPKDRNSNEYKQWQEEHDKVVKLGGLCVIGTERHEARRIDNQLRGRAGRQGDPGESQFYVSMEDDLMRIFGGEKMKSLMTTLKVPEDMPIQSGMVSRAIENSQHKVEMNNFDIRKHLVDYDDVLNKHRDVIYRKRREYLELSKEEIEGEGAGGDQALTLKDKILELIEQEIESIVAFYTAIDNEKEWNIQEIYESVSTIFAIPADLRINLENIRSQAGDKEQDALAREKIIQYLLKLAQDAYANMEEDAKKNEGGENIIRQVEKGIVLRAIDTLWVEHLDAMSYLRTGIGLRGYGQRDPLIEYKQEAFRMFNQLVNTINKEIVYSIYKIGIAQNIAGQSLMQRSGIQLSAPAKTMDNKSDSASFMAEKKVGRNDPCPCGSGKKYKKCCGK